MKKLVSLLMALLMVLSCVFLPGCGEEQGEVVNVYNWGEYIDESIFDDFEAETGIRVNYATFSSNEMLYSSIKSGGSSYDVIIPSDYMIARMIAEDLLLELDYSQIPLMSNMDPQYLHRDYDPQQLYSVPYMWGTTGIIYNTKYITEEIDSWEALWNEEYANRILMFDNSRDSFAIALSLLGYSINTENMDEINEAAELLREQKPLVQAYVMDQIFDKMVGENAWIAPYYAGDYLTMSADNEDLAFAFPKEGSNQFVDAMCIPKGCVNKEAAEMFINFMSEPLISAENCGYVGYSTPISEAKNYMDEEMTSSEVAYPTEDILANTEVFVNLSDDTNKMLDMLWISINVGGLSVGFWITVGVIALGITGFCIYRMQKKKYRMAMRSRDL